MTGTGTRAETGFEGGSDNLVVESSSSSDFTLCRSSVLSLLSCSSSSAFAFNSFFSFGGMGEEREVGVIEVIVNFVPLRVVDGVISLTRGVGKPRCCSAFTSEFFLM